jgi:hypothetical protein
MFGQPIVGNPIGPTLLRVAGGPRAAACRGTSAAKNGQKPVKPGSQMTAWRAGNSMTWYDSGSLNPGRNSGILSRSPVAASAHPTAAVRPTAGTPSSATRYASEPSKGGNQPEEVIVGKGILLWLLGIPLPIIIILLLIWH